jgi:hypothetical protein
MSGKSAMFNDFHLTKPGTPFKNKDIRFAVSASYLKRIRGIAWIGRKI